jgi:hypothetical protein
VAGTFSEKVPATFPGDGASQLPGPLASYLAPWPPTWPTCHLPGTTCHLPGPTWPAQLPLNFL